MHIATAFIYRPQRLYDVYIEEIPAQTIVSMPVLNIQITIIIN